MPRFFWFFFLFILLSFFIGMKSISWRNKLEPTFPESEPFKNIHVEILNGCGKDGLARKIGQYLRSHGFDVMNLSNAKSFNYPETIVIDRVGKPEYASQVAEILGTKNQIQQIVADPFRMEEITVIVGWDYKRLALSLSQ